MYKYYVLTVTGKLDTVWADRYSVDEGKMLTLLIDSRFVKMYNPRGWISIEVEQA